MIYYQFVLKVCPNSLPMTMNTRYRVKERALRAMKRYVKEGLSGCLCTMFYNDRTDYGMKEVEEF